MPGQVMEAPQLSTMQQAVLLTHPSCKQDAMATMAATDMSCLQQLPANANAGAREQCPRCASHDTKFCYYNNYNTSQPRHFCRACRRYWTLGGSLRNVPIGGSTRKRLRPAPQQALRRPHVHFGAPPPAPMQLPPQSHSQPQQGLLGSLFALGGAPLLEGRVGFDLGLGLPGLGQVGLAGGSGEIGMHSLGLRAGGHAGTSAAPLLWPTGYLENGNVDTWKVPGGGAGAMWAPDQFSSVAASRTAAAQVGDLFHGGAQIL